jgi:L-fucose isomerase-like protein
VSLLAGGSDVTLAALFPRDRRGTNRGSVDMTEDQKSFWTSMPGIFTGLAALVSAITGLYIAVKSDGAVGKAGQGEGAASAPTVVAAAVPTPTPTPAPAPAPAPAPVVPTQQALAPTTASPRPSARLPSAAFTQKAVIEDRDGFTFVRAARSANSAVVARVKKGEVFETHQQTGQWWQVRTPDGQVGFMHASRIRVTSN